MMNTSWRRVVGIFTQFPDRGHTMKPVSLSSNAPPARTMFRVCASAAIFAVTMALDVMIMGGTAQSMPIYQDETGQPCSACHTKKGILNKSYLPLNNVGIHYQQFKQLPPPPCTVRNYRLLDQYGNFVQTYTGCIEGQ